MMGEPISAGREPMDDNGGFSPIDGNGQGMSDSMDIPTGDGTDGSVEKNVSSEQQELDDIFNSASLEDKNAILKYAKSQAERNDKEGNGNDGKMPNESISHDDKLVNEIVGSIINSMDMNGREGVKGTKRREKKIANKKIGRNNPFVSGR